MVKNGLRLSFLANTIVEKCNDFTGSMYGFDFRSFKTITNLGVEEDGQFGKHICLLYYICSCNECNQVKLIKFSLFVCSSPDVIGLVIACDDLDCYDKNGKAGKKKPLTLIDAE